MALEYKCWYACVCASTFMSMANQTTYMEYETQQMKTRIYFIYYCWATRIFVWRRKREKKNASQHTNAIELYIRLYKQWIVHWMGSDWLQLQSKRASRREKEQHWCYFYHHCTNTTIQTMHDELRITGGISVKFISFRIKNKQTEKNEWKYILPRKNLWMYIVLQRATYSIVNFLFCSLCSRFIR